MEMLALQFFSTVFIFFNRVFFIKYDKGLCHIFLCFESETFSSCILITINVAGSSILLQNVVYDNYCIWIRPTDHKVESGHLQPFYYKRC